MTWPVRQVWARALSICTGRTHKNELFRAAILREQQRCGADIQRRIAADPQGGLLHRVTRHGMLAALSYPLLVAIISGKSDIFNGFVEANSPEFYHRLAVCHTGVATVVFRRAWRGDRHPG